MKRIYIAVIVLLSIAVFPIILWFVASKQPLSIAVIDKTVPDESYREHQGLIWALNHLKYRKSNTEEYNVTDYYGTNPISKEVESIPLPEDYSKFDVIYLADTYGVFKDDMKGDSSDRMGAHSEKIVGGLEVNEWNRLMDRLMSEKESLFIAEYNSFASPTSQEVRNAMLEYLELDWNGWVGRYFNELSYKKNKEIPQWIVDQFQESWKYEGGGFVLVNDFTNEVVVLELDKHVSDAGIRLDYTKEGQTLFGKSPNANYEYWFDIVTANNDENVLANYQWNLTKDGEKLLTEKGIPLSFAAVTQNHRKNAKTYYFAGDYNDVSRVPKFYQAKGLGEFYKIAQMFSDDAFYWSAYLPMMKSILQDFETPKVKEEEKSESNLGYNARVNGEKFEILQDGKWESITFKGVNMGMGKPGYFPGEAAITENEYYRWFEQIGEMNANTIRVYTLHPPGFYKALARYNKNAKKPLNVLHGVWIEEEGLEETLDAYDPETLKKFHEEMKTIVDVIHGNKLVEPKVGHASGLYDVDVSQYIIGWVIGIEWYPFMVQNTNEIHKDIGQYKGEYFETKNASPFEYWLAEQMDFLTQYEQENYQWIRPMSFTNWVTTDLLDHPSEPSEEEDLVGVNPNVIYTKGLAEQTGQFASYHVYPYFPDFLNYDKNYLNYIDHRGEKNSYAGYLADLRAAHRMPVLIAEFGVPGSRGLTHDNPFGWTQGFVSEQQQGEILTHLYEDIIKEDYLGGFVFTWQDEWFKRTWNTTDYDNPERRPYWSNAQTNEQQFGLLSFDQHKVQVDGDLAEWEGTEIYKEREDLDIVIDHDERYLYIQLKGELLKKSSPRILLDVVPNQGKTSSSKIPEVTFANGVEFIVELNKEDNSRIVIDPYYDLHHYLYGHQLRLIETDTVQEKKESNVFQPILYALNKKLTLPETGEVLPFKSYETGKLIKGNGNPESDQYNSLADYAWTEDGVIELRIPWLLIQSKDPSRKEFVGDIYSDGNEASKFVENISLGFLFVNSNGKIENALPTIENGVMQKFDTYTWENWELPVNTERLKTSYDIMQKTFSQYE
ncbi:hypothetical protein [Lysinibacillus sp. BW-2-10]|uniref:hypothetical protein n=1 Tax=Lysinibacillus sp. BW-2-10 TaxID=2590030 RepID=UPI00117FBE65|nr:hypothetical protein [Lysinibacillus sp. BW-2-10]TSI11467.1 hypothetical protein FJQ64_01365 [Lysinibacillus sp. BW-2-10]